jgi:hypothetical protein
MKNKPLNTDQSNSWYNVKLTLGIQTFIETLRTRVKEEYNISLTKDACVRAILEQGMLGINLDLLNEDPMSLFRTTGEE